MPGRRATIAPIVIGVVGAAILIGLGTWQLQRLTWKESLISELDARLSANPVVLPVSPDPVSDQNLRVRVDGVISPEELDVLTSIKNVGPGFRIIAPMALEDGRRIMVDLGFVPEGLKNIADRPDSLRLKGSGAQGTVTGILRWPELDGTAPPPDEAWEMWFERDVAKIAQALGTEPLLIIAERHPMGDLPVPRPPGIDLPNRHLEYAITWFGLAIAWSGMAMAWLRRELKKPRV
ncbi:MAG: SURF1 family protein [Pseudomonadota bacterium]